MIFRLALLAELVICSALAWSLGCTLAARSDHLSKKVAAIFGWGIGAIAPWVAGMFFLLKFHDKDKLDLSIQLNAVSISAAILLIIMIFIFVLGKLGTDEEAIARAAKWKAKRNLALMIIGLFILGISASVCEKMILKNFEDLGAEVKAEAAKFFPPEIEAEKNAATYYYKAIDLFEKIDPDWMKQVDELRKADPKLQGKSINSFFYKFNEPVSLLRQGTNCEMANWGDNFSKFLISSTDHTLIQSKYFIRILSYSVQMAIDEKKLSQAARDISQLSRLAEHRAAQPTLISVLLSSAAQAESFNKMQELLNKCPVNSNELDLIRISSNFILSDKLYACMKLEKATGLLALLDVGSPLSANRKDKLFPSPYIIIFWPEDLGSYIDLLDRYADACMLPYKNIKIDNLAPKGIMAAVMTPALGKPFKLIHIAQTKRNLMLLACAIHKYATRKNKLPASLNELVPDYIDKLPLDSFTGETFQSIRNDNNLTIYSIGPDLTDNGGVDFDKEFYTGDIVLKMKFE